MDSSPQQPERHATPDRTEFTDTENSMLANLPEPIENARDQDIGQGIAYKRLETALDHTDFTGILNNFDPEDLFDYEDNNVPSKYQDQTSFLNGTQNLVRFCETKNFYVYIISSKRPTAHYLGHCQSPVQLYSQMAESKTDMGVYDIILNRSRYLISYNHVKSVMTIPPQEEMNNLQCVTLRTPKTEQFKIELIEKFGIKFVHVRNHIIMLMVNLTKHDNLAMYQNIISMVNDNSLYSLPFCKNYVTDSGTSISSRALMPCKEEMGNNDIGHPYVESILKASIKLAFQKNARGDITALSKKLKTEYETRPAKGTDNKDIIKFSYKYGSIAKMYFGAPLCNGLTRIKVERIGDAGMIVDYVNQSGKRYTDQDSFIMIHLCNGGRVIITKTKNVFVWIVSQLNADELNIEYLLPSLNFGNHHIFVQNRLGKVEMYRRHNILLWFASLYFNNTISLEDMSAQINLYCKKIKTDDAKVSQFAAAAYENICAQYSPEEANAEEANAEEDTTPVCSLPNVKQDLIPKKKVTSRSTCSSASSSDEDEEPQQPKKRKTYEEEPLKIKKPKVPVTQKQPKKQYLTKSKV